MIVMLEVGRGVGESVGGGAGELEWGVLDEVFARDSHTWCLKPCCSLHGSLVASAGGRWHQSYLSTS